MFWSHSKNIDFNLVCLAYMDIFLTLNFTIQKKITVLMFFCSPSHFVFTYF